MSRATKETEAGRRYLDLQRMAKHTGRPTDELIQLYALEGFLDRLARSVYADQFVLKGGVLLAALDARRPTRDIDLAAQGLDNSAEHVLLLIREIAAIAIDDGLVFNAEHATAETIRDDDHYSGVRVTLGGALSRAAIRLHVDINVGDPIWPEPQKVRLPRLLDGTLLIRGYPLEMVFAEKIVTAIARGTANTRWRDFLDLYVLIRSHAVDAQTLRTSMQHVAQYRDVPLSTFETCVRRLARDRAEPMVRVATKATAGNVSAGGICHSPRTGHLLCRPPDQQRSNRDHLEPAQGSMGRR